MAKSIRFSVVFLSLGVASICIFLCLARLNAAEDSKAANDKQKAPGPQASDKVVVKEIVYGLVEEAGRLHLTSQPIDGADRQLKRATLRFEIPAGATVSELSLQKLDGKNLMAVVKLRQGSEYEFHCLTFIAPAGGHVREGFRFFQAKFFTTPSNFKILALGGKHFEGSVFIVLGDIGYGEQPPTEVTEGVFYFSGCPWPPSDGALSPFRVRSIPPKDVR